MNVCIFSRTFFPAIGGLERITELIARHVASRGYRVEVVTDVNCASGADVCYPFLVTRTTSFRDRIRSIARSDVVILMNISLIGIIPALLLRKSIVASHQGGYRGHGVRGHVLERLKRALTHFVSNVSYIGYVARQLPSSSIVIANAYDADLFHLQNLPLIESDFVFCGRLVSDKGADLLIKAFGRVAEVVADTRLTIIGEGPERPSLEGLAASLGILGKMHFTGGLRHKALVAELAKHRCMIVPSIWE